MFIRQPLTKLLMNQKAFSSASGIGRSSTATLLKKSTNCCGKSGGKRIPSHPIKPFVAETQSQTKRQAIRQGSADRPGQLMM